MATKRLNKTKGKQTAKWQYLGETDPAQYIHSNKTHRSVSEAFRDANYATAFWRSKTDWEEALEFLAGAFLGFAWVGVVVGGAFCFIYWLFN
jgi:hypothetical protein